MDTVFSIVNMWLNNCSKFEVNDIMSTIIDRIPSYKFVSLTYQILSRLGSSPSGSASIPSSSNSAKLGQSAATIGDGFSGLLSKMIMKLCSEHPHHTLPQLFALAHERDIGAQVLFATHFINLFIAVIFNSL